MRRGATLSHLSRMTAAEATTTAKATFTAPASVQRSPWHSPVPYLFGGLAAMLGLIAFALLILACSYWKLSTADDAGDVEAGSGEKGDNGSDDKAPAIFEEKFLVIMAGDVNPTFLATPTTSKTTTSLSDDGNVGTKQSDLENMKEKEETSRENGDDHVEAQFRSQEQS